MVSQNTSNQTTYSTICIGYQQKAAKVCIIASVRGKLTGNVLWSDIQFNLKNNLIQEDT